MAGNAIEAKLRITAETAQAVGKVRELLGQIDQIGGKGRPGGANQPIPGLREATAQTRELNGAIGDVARSVIGLASLGALKGLLGDLLRTRIEAEKLQSALNFTANGSVARIAGELEFVRRVSKELGLDVQIAASEYVKLQSAAKGTSLEGENTRRIFEAVAKAATTFNLSASDTQGVLLALQQIISKGKVSAEELRGQLGERLPGALQIAARALGITIQELDKLLEQGDLLATDFLPRFAAQLERELGDAPQRAAQGTQAEVNRLGNSIRNLKNAANDSGIGDFLLAAIKNLRLETDRIAEGWSKSNVESGGVLATVKGIFDITQKISPGGTLIDKIFGSKTDEQRLDLLKRQLDDAKRFAGELQAGVDSGGATADAQRRLVLARRSVDRLDAQIRSIEEARNQPARDAQGARDSDVRLAREAAASERRAAGLLAVKKVIEDAQTDRQKLESERDRFIKAYQNILSPEDLQKAIDAFNRRIAAKGGSTTRISQFRAAFDSELELLRDAIAREKALNQQRFDDGLQDMNAYLANRRRLEEQSAEAEISRLRAELEQRRETLTTNEQRLATQLRQGAPANELEGSREAIRAQKQDILRLETDIAKKTRDAADATAARVRDESRLTLELIAQQDALAIQLREARGLDLSPGQIRERVLAQFKPQLDRLGQLGGDQSTLLKLVDVEVIRQQLAQVEREFSRVQTDLAQREQAITQQVGAGTKTQAQGEREILALRSQQIPVLDEILQRMEALAGTPEDTQRIQALRLQLGGLKDFSVELERTARGSAVNSLSTALGDIVTGAKTGKEALLDMVGSFTRALLDVLNRRLAEQLLNQFASALPGGGSGGGGFFKAIGSFFGFHSGGVVGQAGAMRISADPRVFALAPRYHGGGIAGLLPDEVPAILKRGEEVLTKDDPRHRTNSRGFGGVSISNQVSISGAKTDDPTVAGAMDDLARTQEAAIDAWAVRQMRPGGLLDGLRGNR